MLLSDKIAPIRFFTLNYLNITNFELFKMLANSVAKIYQFNFLYILGTNCNNT